MEFDFFFLRDLEAKHFKNAVFNLQNVYRSSNEKNMLWRNMELKVMS